MFRIRDNANGNLDAPITSGQLTITVDAGDGANFIDTGDANTVPSNDNPMYCTLVEFTDNLDPTTAIVKQEVIKVINIVGDTFTVASGGRGIGIDPPNSFIAGSWIFNFVNMETHYTVQRMNQASLSVYRSSFFRL